MLSRLAAPCRSKLSPQFLRSFAIKVSSLKKQSLLTQLVRGNGSPKVSTFTSKGCSNAIYRAETSSSPAYMHVSPDASVDLPVPGSGRKQGQHFSSEDTRTDKLPSRSKKQRKEPQHKAGAPEISARVSRKEDDNIDVNTRLPVTACPGVAYTKACVVAKSVSKRGIYNGGKLVHMKNTKADTEKVSVQPQRSREESDVTNVLAEAKPENLGLLMNGSSQESSLHIHNSSLLVECPKNASVFFARNKWIIKYSVVQGPQWMQVLGEFEVDQAACYKLFGTSCARTDWSNCRSVLSFLKELGLSAKSRNYMICKWPSIVKVSVESVMQPTLDFFDCKKIARPTLLKAVESYPRLLSLQGDERLMAMYELFQHVGMSATEFLKALRKMPGACPAVDFISQHKYFLEQGLPDEAFASMLQRNPRLAVVPVKSLKTKLDFLLHTAKWDIWEIVVFPAYFNYSLEARIIPRFKFLEAANLLKIPSLCTLLWRTESQMKDLSKPFGSSER